ncbi:MAG: IscS subfamily cysteine desulfurase [Oceanospirillaceae bacterium]|nr:IscS subfamily cysteine desulfurase [Oceanospirillaceae bacterium]MCP5349847.1 IscS subfamily cysteine desulfurase [Oceanospirillaceae bacterium]
MKLPVYLDYAATTPVDPAVAQAMCACLTLEGNFANPASRSHRYGWEAEEAVESARRQIADAIHADTREIVWTSGATEANNLAIKGVMALAGDKKHLITSAIEHKAVLDTCAYLEQQGFAVTYLQPDASGVISLQQVQAALRADTALVSLMLVNNELGTVNQIAEIGALCRARQVLLHVDAAQGVGKVAVDVQAMQVDLLSVSAHKFYGPKGIGCLYVRRGLKIAAQIHGGGHERGMRSGTLATHQIVGLGLAAELAVKQLAEESQRILALRQRLLEGLLPLGGVNLNGDANARVAGIANISFAGVDGESLLLSLNELAVSTGSACNSASMSPSYVLAAIGVEESLAHASIRFSLGRYTTADEIEHAIAHVSHAVQRLRSLVA